MSHHAKMEHAEPVSKDPAATQKLLEKAFGLKFAVMGPEMGNYRMHGRQEGASARAIGIREPMGPEGPCTVSYLTVPNIDEAIKSVKGAGAKIIMEKTEIPKTRYTAVYVAPGGVTQGLFQMMTPGRRSSSSPRHRQPFPSAGSEIHEPSTYAN